MDEVDQVHVLLNDAGIEHIMLNGVFACKGANGNIARISNYEDDDSQFQAKLDGLTPKQAVAALIASLKEEVAE
jgi:hypothetical protein